MNPSLDMADAFDGLTEVATLITPSASVLASDGFERHGIETQTAINVVTWPSTGEESLQVGDGARTQELRTFATLTELRSADVATGAPAQRIIYQGDEYALQRSEPYKNSGFWVAIGVRVGQ